MFVNENARKDQTGALTVQGNDMRSSLGIGIKLLALVLLACALFLSGLAVLEFAERLVINGCIAQVFGGPKARAVSCFNGVLGSGVYFIMAGVVWWALHGALLLIPREPGWGALGSVAKYAGGTAGALMTLLLVVPIALTFFLYIVYPLLVLLFSSVLFLGAWLFGHVFRALGG
jgi:hypothetical protein